MTRLTRALRALTLPLLAGGALALSAELAEAQGRGRKSGHDKQKRAERDIRRDDRRLRLDDRMAVRRDDRDRYDDRDRDRHPNRERDRSPDRYPERYPDGRTLPPIRLPWP